MSRAAICNATKTMRAYLLPVMKQVFGDKCAVCGQKSVSYEIDHLKYSDKVTMYDLQLLCAACHWAKTEADSEAYLTRTPHCATCTCYDKE